MQSLTHAYDILKSRGIGDTNGEVVSKSDYRKLKTRGIIFCIIIHLTIDFTSFKMLTISTLS